MAKQVKVAPRKLLILGAGGLGTEYAWVAEEAYRAALKDGREAVWEILGFTDDDPQKKETLVAGHLVHGTIQETLAKFGRNGIAFAAAIGSNKAREMLSGVAEAAGWTPVTLVHPSAIVAGDAQIGTGSYLAPGTVVCPGAQLGRYVIVNTHASIGHGSSLEDFVQICPGVRVSGGCRVGKRGFLGSNASLVPKAVVGEEAIVGANSLVIRTVRPRTTVVGCPAVTVARATE